MGMRVGELARRTGVGVSTLRAWERRFQFLQPRRSPSGHRLYEEADVERVDTVLRLVGEGLTLASAIARVANAGAAGLPAGEAEALLYGQILQAADQGIWVSRDGRTRYVNRRMAEIMGYTVEELLPIPVLDFFDPAALPLIRERTALARTGHRLHFTVDLRRADGTMFLAEIDSTPLINSAGLYEGAVSVVNDITDRKEPDAQAHLRRERDRLGGNLRTSERQAETLALLGAQILRQRTSPDGAALVVTEAVDATRRLLQADQAIVLELSVDLRELRVAAASPQIDHPIAVPSGSRSFPGYTVFARKVIVVDNRDLDRRFDPVPTQPGGPTASAIGAPIFGPEGIRGVLIAESSTPELFDLSQAHFIQGMANIIGTALLA
jgi:PAS domain S-box-containing protein